MSWVVGTMKTGQSSRLAPLGHRGPIGACCAREQDIPVSFRRATVCFLHLGVGIELPDDLGGTARVIIWRGGPVTLRAHALPCRQHPLTNSSLRHC